MSEKEQKKKEKELKNGKTGVAEPEDAACRTEQEIDGQNTGSLPGAQRAENRHEYGRPGGQGAPDQTGYGNPGALNMPDRPEPGNPGMRNASDQPGYGGRGMQGPQGGYGYQNPYQNYWQNQRYYGNDYSRRDWNGYNNYPNQNYGNVSQGNPYGWQQGNYTAHGGAGSGDNGEKKPGKKKKALAVMGITALLALCAGAVCFAVYMWGDGRSEEVQQAAAQPQDPKISQVDLDAPEEGGQEEALKPSQGSLTDVSDLVERIMPSVVSVNAVYTYSSYYWDNEKYDGGGSGFIIGENETELLIATNSHVVADSEDLTVAFVDETKADAMVKGYDNDLDVAVIAVRLQDISEETKKAIAVARLGDSTALKAGQAVISIGNALLLGQSVTTGIISATNAPVGGGYDEMGNQYGSDDRVMIQTTAIMNPGCSGGVLINSAGEVIGINTMTISAIDVEGMCYAIPISDAIPILDNLKMREIRERLKEEDSGFLGISCSDVERREAEEYGIPDGVYVREAEEDGPADKAGIRKGDVIVALNEVKVGTMNELSEMLRYYPVGEIVDVEIMRYEDGDYQSQIVSVKLGRK